MLLRFRSRTATSKQAEGVKPPNSTTTTATHTIPSPRNANMPLFGSPRPMFLGNFTAKHHPSPDQPLISPTSILDHKPISPALLWREKSLPRPPTTFSGNQRHSWENPGRLGLIALFDPLADEPKPETKVCSRATGVTKRVLLGSQLRIQIPPNPHGQTGDSVRTAGCASEAESQPMELSESYTRVIYHGTNPRITHIFDNRVLESCCGVVGSHALNPKKKKEEKKNQQHPYISSENSNSRFLDFLRFCHKCGKSLGQGRDIFMYRGERAFCSPECRSQGMMLDELGHPESWDCC